MWVATSPSSILIDKIVDSDVLTEQLECSEKDFVTEKRACRGREVLKRY